MKRAILAVMVAISLFAAPTVVSIAANEVAPEAAVQLETGEPTFTGDLPADDFIGVPAKTPVIQLDASASAHNYYTCRQDFHSHNGWFIRYMGWFWKYDSVRGYSYQVYVHRHYLLKPVSEHYRQTRCS